MTTDARKLEGLLRNDFRAFIHKVFTTLCPMRGRGTLRRSLISSSAFAGARSQVRVLLGEPS